MQNPASIEEHGRLVRLSYQGPGFLHDHVFVMADEATRREAEEALASLASWRGLLRVPPPRVLTSNTSLIQPYDPQPTASSEPAVSDSTPTAPSIPSAPVGGAPSVERIPQHRPATVCRTSSRLEAALQSSGGALPYAPGRAAPVVAHAAQAVSYARFSRPSAAATQPNSTYTCGLTVTEMPSQASTDMALPSDVREGLESCSSRAWRTPRPSGADRHSFAAGAGRGDGVLARPPSSHQSSSLVPLPRSASTLSGGAAGGGGADGRGDDGSGHGVRGRLAAHVATLKPGQRSVSVSLMAGRETELSHSGGGGADAADSSEASASPPPPHTQRSGSPLSQPLSQSQSQARGPPQASSARSHGEQQLQLLSGLQTSAWSTLLRSSPALQVPKRSRPSRGHSVSTLSYGPNEHGSDADTGLSPHRRSGDGRDWAGGGSGRNGEGGAAGSSALNLTAHSYPASALLQAPAPVYRPCLLAAATALMAVEPCDSDSGMLPGPLGVAPARLGRHGGGGRHASAAMVADLGGCNESLRHNGSGGQGLPRTGSGPAPLTGTLSIASSNQIATCESSRNSARLGPGGQTLSNVSSLNGAGGSVGGALPPTSPGGGGAMTRLLGITLATVASRRRRASSASPHLLDPGSRTSQGSLPWAPQLLPPVSQVAPADDGVAPLAPSHLPQRHATSAHAPGLTGAPFLRASMTSVPEGISVGGEWMQVDAARERRLRSAVAARSFLATAPEPPPAPSSSGLALLERCGSFGEGRAANAGEAEGEGESGAALQESEAQLLLLSTAGASRSPLSTMVTNLFSTQHTPVVVASTSEDPDAVEGEGEGEANRVLGTSSAAMGHSEGLPSPALTASTSHALSSQDAPAPANTAPPVDSHSQNPSSSATAPHGATSTTASGLHINPSEPSVGPHLPRALAPARSGQSSNGEASTAPGADLLNSITLHVEDGRTRFSWTLMMGSGGTGEDMTSQGANHASQVNLLDTGSMMPSLTLRARTLGTSTATSATPTAASVSVPTGVEVLARVSAGRRLRPPTRTSPGCASDLVTGSSATPGTSTAPVIELKPPPLPHLGGPEASRLPDATAHPPEQESGGPQLTLQPSAVPQQELSHMQAPAHKPAPAGQLLPSGPSSGNVHGPVVTGLLAAAAARRASVDLRARPFLRGTGSSSGKIPSLTVASGMPSAAGGTAAVGEGGFDPVSEDGNLCETPREPARPEPRWHEVSLTRFVHPELGKSVILVVQNDVSSRIWAERQLARVVEAEHTLLEGIFPHHVIQHIATAAAEAAEDSAEGHALGPAAGQGPAAGPVDPHLPAIRGDTFLHLATSHKALTVLFCDIQGFTPMCKAVPPMAVMAFLNDLFTRLDGLLDHYGVYKVETIGDCYVAAGGLMKEDEQTGAVTVRSDDVDPQHAYRTVQFAKALLRAAAGVTLPTTGQPVRLRVGIHSGPAMSGVVGTRMPRFCLFGDTMNTASRMESTGEPGAIHVSEATRDLVPGEAWLATGGVEVKGKGVMDTFLLRP